MDEIEEKLYHDLNLETNIPSKCEVIIKEGLNKKKKHYSLIKILTTACASLLITAGMVYASTTIIEKIWKQPEKVVGFYSEENTNEITEEEKASAMSEQEAIEKAKELLKKFGHEGEKIILAEFEKNDNNLVWYIKTDNETSIRFDAKSGNKLNVFFYSTLNGNIDGYRTTEEKAEKTARDFCKKNGYDLSEYSCIEISSNMESEEESYIWYVDFYKEYDGFVNRYEQISIAFVPKINELYYFIVYEGEYENNKVEISEEQAKQIVLNEEEKIDTVYEIKNVTTNLDIVKMNGDAYFRVTDYKQYRKQQNVGSSNSEYVEYYTDGIIRKAWVVTIEYDMPRFGEVNDNSYNPFDRRYAYYVDATTGEIIGGKCIYKPIITRYEDGKLVVVKEDY